MEFKGLFPLFVIYLIVSRYTFFFKNNRCASLLSKILYLGGMGTRIWIGGDKSAGNSGTQSLLGSSGPGMQSQPDLYSNAGPPMSGQVRQRVNCLLCNNPLV